MLATGGLYAPTIRHHNGITYILCTNIIRPGGDEDIRQNFIVSTPDIWSNEWSDPVFFDFDGIDPSILFEDDGRAFIQGSASPGPMTKIRQFEVDVQTGKKLSEEREIWDGTGGIYPEGPHLYKKDGWYYLMISEGGTHENHMITVARSKDIWGPYEAFEKNPILTARGTDNYIRYTGHCDMFQDQSGAWWGVCLGVRKDLGARYIMGRETFLTSGTWAEGDWPKMVNVKPNPILPNGTEFVCHKDSHALTAVPMVDYVYIRDADLKKHQFSSDGKGVTLTAGKGDLSQWKTQTTFVGKRQRQLDGKSTVTMHNASTTASKELIAGLALYKDECRFARVFYDFAASNMVFQAINKAKSINKTSKQPLKLKENVDLCLEYTESSYRFSFRSGGTPTDWTTLGTLDTLELTGPDFVGPIVGVFAVGDTEDVHVPFDGLEID